MSLKALYIETPLYHHAELSARLATDIYLKMECYQPVGSFKARGIGHLCQQAVADGKTHLISSSGGNAGYAAAYAGKQLGIRVTVVVPESTSDLAKQRISAEGATVIVRGSMWSEADAHAKQLIAEDERAAYIHPFDDASIWEGHATMIDEAAQQDIKPEAVALCVGGGGLLCGVLTGMHRVGWQDVPLLALETQGADSFAQSVAMGERVTLAGITSIAKTLGAAQVAQAAFEWTQRHDVRPLVVTDDDAVDACLRFADDMRVVVEPSCGATLSLLYRHQAHLAQFDSILLIVCGGAGVTIQQLHDWISTDYA